MKKRRLRKICLVSQEETLSRKRVLRIAPDCLNLTSILIVENTNSKQCSFNNFDEWKQNCFKNLYMLMFLPSDFESILTLSEAGPGFKRMIDVPTEVLSDDLGGK